MRIALVAPPFIPVPPHGYGGTELFIAHLAEGLITRGHEVVVYANGESRLSCEVRAIFQEKDWPPKKSADMTLKSLEHSAWAIRDAVDDEFDVVHLNDALALPLSRFLTRPCVYTMHHPHEPALSEFYAHHPWVTFVAISEQQRKLEELPRVRTIHHGIKITDYRFVAHKQNYLAFLGRMAPVKGPHLAIEAARKAGMPLKLAGEVQPTFQDYWQTKVEPHIDGRMVEFLGEATPNVKNELLGNASALLFPIQWDEPFGLVMIESMACGTPVLAFRGGAVVEIVRDGLNGWICRDTDDMAQRVRDIRISPRECRAYVEHSFSVERMTRDYEQLYQGCGDEPLLEVSLGGAAH
jgi:glycosyltransferase involved in cell wall biosynthesis